MHVISHVVAHLSRQTTARRHHAPRLRSSPYLGSGPTVGKAAGAAREEEAEDRADQGQGTRRARLALRDRRESEAGPQTHHAVYRDEPDQNFWQPALAPL